MGAFLDRASRVLCERHSELLATAFYKKDRGGRLFLDAMGARVEVGRDEGARGDVPSWSEDEGAGGRVMPPTAQAA